MKKISCDVCGSHDIVKISYDIFECKSCGCKYSTEQVRQLYSGEERAKDTNFMIVAGVLTKYNGIQDRITIPYGVKKIGH